MADTLFISGYWPLPANRKYSASHYERLLPETIALIAGRRLLFFSDSVDVLEHVDGLARRHGIASEGSLLPLTSLPMWDLAGDMVEACRRMGLDAWPAPVAYGREKGVTHYWRDFRGSGEVAYRQLLAIWLSKVALVATQAGRDPACDALAWIDITLARIRGARTNWRFWEIEDVPDTVSHYSSPMRFHGRDLPVSAGYLSAAPSVWPRLAALFERTARQAALMAYAHDEETILGQCHAHSPDLFRCVGRPLASPQAGNVSSATVAGRRWMHGMRGWWRRPQP